MKGDSMSDVLSREARSMQIDRAIRFQQIERLCDRIQDHVSLMGLGEDTVRGVNDVLDGLLAGLEMAIDIDYVLEVNK